MISQAAHERLHLAARVAGISVAAVVDQLTMPSVGTPTVEAVETAGTGAGEVGVYAVYRGERVEGSRPAWSDRRRGGGVATV
jgi:hypothetical protein